MCFPASQSLYLAVHLSLSSPLCLPVSWSVSRPRPRSVATIPPSTPPSPRPAARHTHSLPSLHTLHTPHPLYTLPPPPTCRRRPCRTVSTLQPESAQNFLTVASSLKSPVYASRVTMPAGDCSPFGSRIATRTPMLCPASAIMRPSWPPPSTPTTGKCSCMAAIVEGHGGGSVDGRANGWGAGIVGAVGRGVTTVRWACVVCVRKRGCRCQSRELLG